MFRTFFAWLLCATLAALPAGAQEPTALSLQQAIDKALTHSPRLQSAVSARAAGQGEHLQAGLLPNPEIGLQTENVAGGGQYRGFDSAETTLALTQKLEWGGKRGRRQDVAAQGLALSGFDYEAERLNLIRDVTVAYADTVAAEEEWRLAGEQRDIAAALLRDVNRRVGAGREPLIQRSKAEISATSADFSHARAEREFRHRQHLLASLWGGHHERYQLESADFFRLTPPVDEEAMEQALANDPSLRRWEAERARSEAVLELEQAQAVPDPSVSVSLRDFRNTGDRAMVAGIAIPLPVFNRNQGSIERAVQEVAKTESDAATARLTLRNTAFEAHEDMINAYHQAESLRGDILPAAEKAFRLAREGYAAGKFAYLEVLDSQRTLFEMRRQYVISLKDYHRARADLERLTAAHSLSKKEAQATEGESHAK